MSYDNKDARSIPALTPRKRLSYLSGNSGFTMVELMMVVAILAALIIMAMPAYENLKDRARTSICMTEIRDMEKLIYSWSGDNGGAFPDLLSRVPRTTLNDPWGKPYVYTNLVTDPGSARLDPVAANPLNADFDLYSKGADLDTDTADAMAAKCQDDILRAGDGGFVGLAEKLLNVAD